MRKLVPVFILFCFISNISYSQTIGLKAGYNLSKYKAVSNWYPDIDVLNAEHISVGGFQFGPTIDFPLSKLFSIESGILFMTKGNNWELKTKPGDSIYYQNKRRTYNLHIPLVFNTKIPIGNVLLIPSVGGYLGIGLKATAENEDSKWSLNYGNEVGDLNRLDFGVSFGVGLEYKQYFLGTTYDLGLLNANAGTSGPNSTIVYHNRTLSFSVGYRFIK